MEKGITIRIFIAGFLLIVSVILYFIFDSEKPNKLIPANGLFTQKYTLAEIDSAVETVLYNFNIDKNWIKRSEVLFPETEEKRIERRVAVPPDILLAAVNIEMKKTVKDFNLQVIAFENTKENSVTFQIHDEKKIIQTIIFKVTKNLQRKEKSYQLKKS